MKSILHLKDDTEYQIPLREDDRAKVGTTAANPEVNAEKEDEKKVDDKKKADDKKKVDGEGEATTTQSQDDIDATEVYEEDSDENPNQEPSNTGNSSSDTTTGSTTTGSTTTENVPPADTAKAALDEMKKLASQGGVIHPSLFISNFSKILGLMERAMQLQVKESGSATKESGSVTKEKAPKATEEKASETTEKTETPTGDKQGELNVNTNNNRS